MFHLETEERGEPLTEASIHPAIAVEACRGWTKREGENGGGEETDRRAAVAVRESHTHTHRRWIRMEEEANGP